MDGNAPSNLGGTSLSQPKNEKKPNKYNWYQEMMDRIQRKNIQLSSFLNNFEPTQEPVAQSVGLICNHRMLITYLDPHL